MSEEKKEPERVQNIRGDVVDSGMHVCSVCKQETHAIWMWATDLELKCCLACYYDL